MALAQGGKTTRAVLTAVNIFFYYLIMDYGCQQIFINPDKNTKALLEYVCTEANNLMNCGIYYSRQYYFKTGKFPSKADLHKQMGTIQKNKHYQALYSDTAQQILTGVTESFYNRCKTRRVEK